MPQELEDDLDTDTGADDLFDDIDEDSEADLGDDEPELPTPAEPGDAGEAEMIRDLIAGLAEKGIVVPESDSCKSFCEHLGTALKTHNATLAVAQGTGGEATVSSGPSEPAVEESPMMMSTAVKEHFDPAVRQLGQTVGVLSEQVQTSRRRGYLRRIGRLEKKGLVTAAHAGELRQKAGGIQLSLNRQGDAIQRNDLDVELDALERAVGGVNLSTVTTLPNPLMTPSEEVNEMVSRLTTTGTAAKNGKR